MELMQVGIFTFNTEYMMRTDKVARAAEERGFESLWVPEHTHIPVPRVGEKADPETGMPMRPQSANWQEPTTGEKADPEPDMSMSPADFFLPEEYRHLGDPFTTLAAAAAVTSKIKLGTCVCLINQHNPLNLAKHISTLDHLSDGRFIFGIGAGWNVDQMGHHGVQFSTRWRELRERLQALRSLWCDERASFNGEFVQFAESWQYPKPVQAGGPPVVLGTMDTPFGREQVARYGDGWLPLTFDMDETKHSLADVHARMSAHGRDPSKLDVSLFFLADEIQSEEAMAKARDSGANRVILRLPIADEASVLKVFDSYAVFIS